MPFNSVFESRPGLEGRSTCFRTLGDTMRAEIVAYMIYLEGPEYPEYAMHFFPRVFWEPQIWEYVR